MTGAELRSATLWIAAIFVALLAQAAPVQAEIRIDDTAARAVLVALGNPNLGKAEATGIAQLPGNRAIVRKLVELRLPASEDGFADALVAAAHGDDKPTSYGFAWVRAHRLTTLKLIDEIDSHPDAFVGWVRDRLAPFTPQGVMLDATGYLLAGGSAHGFVFDTPDFYMDISAFGAELGTARVIMAHELFHSVQNLTAEHATGIQTFDFNRRTYEAMRSGADRDCYATRAYFTSLVAEGTATLVGNPELLPKDGDYANAERRRRQGGFGDLEQQLTLLDMSLKAVAGLAPLAEESVYAVGFYGGAQMYDVGFAMARAIAASDGPAAIGRLISEPPENFVRRYIALTRLHSDLRPLGPIATRWAARAGCPG